MPSISLLNFQLVIQVDLTDEPDGDPADGEGDAHNPDVDLNPWYRKQILAHCDDLSENVILRASRMLQREFPDIAGLDDPVCLLKKTIRTDRPFVQIRLVNENHWVTVSNRFASLPKSVQLYDSLATKPLDRKMKTQLVKILGLTSGWQIETMKVSAQSNCHDCGVHAIANAVALCNDVDPLTVSLHGTEHIRKHLLGCFLAGTMTVFPHQRRSLRQQQDPILTITSV